MVSTENIKDTFPYPTIPKFPGRPDFDSIAAVHTKLKANAASIHSNLGGGNHGLLGLALQPGTYTILTGHVFEPPSNPGPTANIPNGLKAHKSMNSFENMKHGLNCGKPTLKCNRPSSNNS